MEEAHALHSRIIKGEKHLQMQVNLVERQVKDLQQKAATEFAELNGWKHSKAHFTVDMLVRGSPRRKRDDLNQSFSTHLFDHAVYFCEIQSSRPVAIVGQPYNPDITRARVSAMRLDLSLNVSPNLMASWWYPNRTGFFCFTRPGRYVSFLPEQTIKIVKQ
jgi:hypothetical protein